MTLDIQEADFPRQQALGHHEPVDHARPQPAVPGVGLEYPVVQAKDVESADIDQSLAVLEQPYSGQDR
jgi:hypothetical protein